MEESDELFDYIADLPSDNVLEICNFVLIGNGGGGGEGGGGVGDGEGRVEEGGVVEGGGTGCDDGSFTQYNNNFVEILDYQVEHSNNNNNNINNNINNNERIVDTTLNEGHNKVCHPCKLL